MEDFLESSWACLAGWSALRRDQRAVRPWRIFFRRAFFFKLFRFFVDLGRFWEVKMEPKLFFGRIFFDVFFECVFASNLEGLL